jgi:hypothetical protein
MSAEHIRRRLVLKLGGKPDAEYIDKISKFLLQLEQEKKAQIQIINYSKKKKNTLIFNFDNGNAYELFNYVDPFRDKPKPSGYQPPKMNIRDIDVEITDESDASSFSITHFVLWALFAGLVCLSAMLVWLIYSFRFETY